MTFFNICSRKRVYATIYTTGIRMDVCCERKSQMLGNLPEECYLNFDTLHRMMKFLP